MELESAIQELLSRLEFVSLPGLGSFEKKYEHATPSADGKSFDPPREFFVFDTKRVFNDEALENFVAESFGLDHGKATEVVEKFVAGIKGRLESNTEVVFPGVGILMRNSGGTIELTSSDDVISQTFGLGRVEVSTKVTEKKKVEIVTPTLKPEPKPFVKQEDKAKPAPKPQSKKGIFVPVFIILAIMAIAATLVFVPELRFWENIKSSSKNQVVQTTLESEVVVLPSDSSVTTNDSLETTENINSTDTAKVTQPEKSPVIAVTDKKAALYYQETSTPESKTFYIIAGSFSQENNAQKLIQELSAKGYRPILLQTDNMYRVAVYKFTNRDRALRELERLKAQKLSNKVWLLSI